MQQNEKLLRAVIAAPDDDGPRLVYADWFDEQGQPERAEFIRVQCYLDRLPGDETRRKDLQTREAELLGRFGWAWAEEFGTEISEWQFHRGFIERVEMGLEQPCMGILNTLNKAPIRHIRDTSQFCEFGGVVEALPQLERLTGLEFWWLYAFDDGLLGHGQRV